MRSDRLPRLADSAALLLAVLVAALGIRLVSVAAARALRVTPPTAGTQAVPSAKNLVVRRVPSRLRDGGFEDVAVHRKVERKAVPPSARDRSHRPRRQQTVTVAVTVGPPRSEVYFKGRRLGSTPFFGELDCVPDQPLQIDVVPPKGMPLEFTRVCRPGATLSIAPGAPKGVEDSHE